MDLKERSLTQIKVNRHPWEIARYKIIRHLIKKEIKGKRPFSILDIGSGDRYVVDNILNDFPDTQLCCIDTAYETVETQPDNRIKLFARWEELEIAYEGNFNLVLLLDVIEHIEDEVSFLKDLLRKKFITPNTQFIITVPAFPSLFTTHDVFLGHYRRYTRETLIRQLKLTGLETTSSGYFFITLLLPRKLKQWMQKGKTTYATEKGIGSWQGGKLLTYWLVCCLYADYSILQVFKKVGIKLPGLSLYAICQKPV
jgi:trans-aconitate methyltransferase